MTRNFIMLAMAVFTMLLLGIYNFKLGEYPDGYCVTEEDRGYCRITTEEDVRKYTSSKYYEDYNHTIVWDLDHPEDF